jgi:hypothetical protein
MNKVDDWKRKMEKLREKSYAIQRNTMSLNLDQSTMRSSKALVSTLSLLLTVFSLKMGKGAFILRTGLRLLLSSFPHLEVILKKTSPSLRRKSRKLLPLTA